MADISSESTTIAWTPARRGGGGGNFPPEAMAAFGRRGGRQPTTNAAFPMEAASAFGRAQAPIPSNRQFPPDAMSAFGGAHDDGTAPRESRHQFPDGAAAAFGKKKSRAPTEVTAAAAAVVEPANTLWASISQALPTGTNDTQRNWTGSALRRKAPVIQTPVTPRKTASALELNEESMFPALGAASPKPAAAAAAAAASVPVSPIVTSPKAMAWGSKSSSTASFADVIRKRAEEEEREREREARRRAEEERRRQEEENDTYDLRHGPRVGRVQSHNMYSYDDADDEQCDDGDDYEYYASREALRLKARHDVGYDEEYEYTPDAPEEEPYGEYY